jgi:hypothetical protein
MLRGSSIAQPGAIKTVFLVRLNMNALFTASVLAGLATNPAMYQDTTVSPALPEPEPADR